MKFRQSHHNTGGKDGYFYVGYSTEKSMYTMLHSESDEREFEYFTTTTEAIRTVNMRNNIGKTASYIVNDSNGSEYRQATIVDVEFHKLLFKDVYILKSDYGNLFKLSEQEVENIY